MLLSALPPLDCEQTGLSPGSSYLPVPVLGHVLASGADALRFHGRPGLCVGRWRRRASPDENAVAHSDVLRSISFSISSIPNCDG